MVYLALALLCFCTEEKESKAPRAALRGSACADLRLAADTATCEASIFWPPAPPRCSNAEFSATDFLVQCSWWDAGLGEDYSDLKEFAVCSAFMQHPLQEARGLLLMAQVRRLRGSRYLVATQSRARAPAKSARGRLMRTESHSTYRFLNFKVSNP